MTERKKMTVAESRDEWRDLCLTERERADVAEAMAATYKADLDLAEKELAWRRTWRARWDLVSHDAAFVMLLLLVMSLFLWVITR